MWVCGFGIFSAAPFSHWAELVCFQACPYFLSRGIKDQSDLIICPYNYLVDPLIRDSVSDNTFIK